MERACGSSAQRQERQILSSLYWEIAAKQQEESTEEDEDEEPQPGESLLRSTTADAPLSGAARHASQTILSHRLFAVSATKAPLHRTPLEQPQSPAVVINSLPGVDYVSGTGTPVLRLHLRPHLHLMCVFSFSEISVLMFR